MTKRPLKIEAPEMFNEKDYLTTPEACEYLNIKKTKFWEIRKRYNLPAGKVGRFTIYRKHDLRALCERAAFGVEQNEISKSR